MTLTRTGAIAQIDRCIGHAYTVVQSADDAMILMMEAIDDEKACWLKG